MPTGPPRMNCRGRMGPPLQRTGNVNATDSEMSNPCFPTSATVSTTYVKLDQNTRAITATKQELSAKVDTVTIELGLLHADKQKWAGRVIQVECDVAEVCPMVRELERQGTGAVLPLCPPLGYRQQPIFAHFLFCRDKEILLRVARAASPLHHDNARVHISPNYILSVPHRRAFFLGVKSKLQLAGLRYSPLFQAKLKVRAGNKTIFFTEPADVWDWLERRCDEASSPSSPEGQCCSPKNVNKRRQVPHCRPKAAVQRVPSSEQVRKEQAQELTTEVTLWADRCSPQDLSLNHDLVDSASMHSEVCITLQPLPNVTPQMSDEIL
ncbi:hypothetical protein NDU88_006979 [Pleurodeles waltl]|uniref:Uncharacterized protein n=1 Tax=Pleurodeles waltl TaxID=8319 RepID=A0AAV7M1M2_PLEWA|nr:hypothetical protein NDU88_006979 [Pleurodeles waltl]